jgi:hypothetical protein
MSDEPTGSQDPGSRPAPTGRNWWDRGAVWLVLIVIGVVASLGAAGWYERDRGDVSAAPAEPSTFCNTVGELHARGAITFASDDPAGSLQAVSDGLGRLGLAGPPAQIRRDLEGLRLALDPVIRRALASRLDEPATPSELSDLLADRTRPLQPESDRLNAYTRRWCGVDLNGVQDPDEGAGVPAVPPSTAPPTAPPG